MIKTLLPSRVVELPANKGQTFQKYPVPPSSPPPPAPPPAAVVVAPPKQEGLELPAISVQRPSYVSELVDEKALNLLRSRYPVRKQSVARKGRPLSLDVDNWPPEDLTTRSKSEHSLPKLKRASSFRLKLSRTASEGVQGYKPLDSSFSSEANLFSRERVTSISHIMSNKSSPSSSVLSSPRLPRSKVFFPANNRIILFDSSDNDSDSDTSESNLDFNFGASREVSLSHQQQVAFVLVLALALSLICPSLSLCLGPSPSPCLLALISALAFVLAPCHYLCPSICLCPIPRDAWGGRSLKGY